MEPSNRRKHLSIYICSAATLHQPLNYFLSLPFESILSRRIIFGFLSSKNTEHCLYAKEQKRIVCLREFSTKGTTMEGRKRLFPSSFKTAKPLEVWWMSM
jgi:hypothetical protein